MATAFPELAPLHELRATLAQMRNWKLAVGQDGRNRCILADLGEKDHRGYSPFGAKTGRNTPSNSEFIFGLATWLRSLIRPERGMAVAYLDYEQQEFGIAAALSGDRNMMCGYRSGDPYLAFAIQAGAVPSDATKNTHGPVRDQFKQCALGIQYAMGAEALAQRLGESASRGRELLQLHRRTYPDYWRWSEGCVSHAMLHGSLTASFGWRVHVGPDTRPTTLRNFLLQANRAEMLRLACILAHERGLPVCCPIHDALLVEGPADAIDDIVDQTRQAMRDASELVLPEFPLRVEAKVFRWPERFSDKRGRQMWDTVQGLIGRVEVLPGQGHLSRRWDTPCPTAGLFPVPSAGHSNGGEVSLRGHITCPAEGTPAQSYICMYLLSPVIPCPMRDPDAAGLVATRRGAARQGAGRGARAVVPARHSQAGRGSADPSDPAALRSDTQARLSGIEEP
jgi:hypothetical protein